MRLSINVHPNSKEEKIEKISDNEFIAYVKASPVEGKANQALIKALSGYFDTAKSRIKVVRGSKTKHKIVEIID